MGRKEQEKGVTQRTQRKSTEGTEKKTQEHSEESLCHNGEERPASEGGPYSCVGDITFWRKVHCAGAKGCVNFAA
jgi:hypothetical protein